MQFGSATKKFLRPIIIIVTPQSINVFTFADYVHRRNTTSGETPMGLGLCVGREHAFKESSVTAVRPGPAPITFLIVILSNFP